MSTKLTDLSDDELQEFVNSLYFGAFSVLRDKTESQDVVQSKLLSLLEKETEFTQRGGITFGKNAAKNAIRAAEAHRKALLRAARLSLPEDWSEQKQEQLALWRQQAIDLGFTLRQQALISLLTDGFKREEIQELLGLKKTQFYAEILAMKHLTQTETD